MNSFIKWVGGKSQLRKHICAYFPEDPPERYIEVFGGAGWILFSCDKHAPMEIFNDIDGNLINLYRCVKHHCTELQRELRGDEYKWLPSSRELFSDYLQQLDMRGLTDIQRAARYFYVIRVSYGAGRRSFGCTDTSNIMLHTIDRLPDIQKRLQGVLIENRDFEALLKTYDRKNALAYIDPPYYNAEEFYDGFSVEDHERLFGALRRMKGRFILSYNDHPVVRRLYKDYHIHGVERANALTHKHGEGQEKYREVIITNF